MILFEIHKAGRKFRKITNGFWEHNRNTFPLKLYEQEKKSKYTLSEVNPQDALASQIYAEEKNILFAMIIDDTIIFSDSLGNIKFFSLKEQKFIKTLQHSLALFATSLVVTPSWSASLE